MKHTKAFLPVYKSLKTFSGFFRKKGGIPHYEGVYSYFPSDLGVNVFDQVYWIESVKWYLEKDRAQSRDPKFVLEHYLTVFATLLTIIGSHRKVIALDFGGGIGNTYVPLMAYVRDNLDFEYHIVDTPNNCALGRELFMDEGRIIFHEAVPEIPLDLLLSSSTIQYIEGWRDVLQILLRLRPLYAVLTRLPTTEGKTFATKQNIVVSYGPHNGRFIGSAYHWFFNRRELKNVMKDNGYATRFDLFYSDYAPLVANLSEGFRECTLRTMLFERE